MKALKKPIILLLITTIMAFALLFFYRTPMDVNILYIGGSVMLISAITYFAIVYFKLGDEYLFLIVSMLVVLGTLMLCRINYTYGIKQIIWYLLSVSAFYVSFFIYKYVKILNKLGTFYFIVGVILFIATLLFGTRSGGAKNWIRAGILSVQPSEFIKLLYIFFLASYFSGKKDKLVFGRIKEKYALLFCVYMYLGFLVLQREWGIAVLFFIIYIAMEYIFEHDLMLILCNFLLAGLGGGVGYLTMYHIQVRVATWLNPWADVSKTGYQIAQSLFAISSGGFFGSGLGLGKPEYIPAVHTDFIFSAICEELGLFGGVAIILLFFIFTYRGAKIALKLPEGFDKCIASGITVMFGMQTFIILGGVIKLIPLTGITLPFISYGGSSLLSSFIALGVLQALSDREVSK
ncbi:MAG: FtsW/RodA/SpoVE family cell cycle protein [Clostridia bacterium]|nr:FtsW/RodA/SpoVE family cell cycle protein [Clostridia bacterium]